MANTTFFTIITTALGVTRALPQLIRLLRTRHAHGVSVDTSATSTFVSAGWAVYGFWTDQLALSVASIATTIIFVLITLATIRFGHQWKELKIAPIWMTTLLLFGGIGGPTGLSLALLFSGLIANIPQVRVAYKEKNLADLSLLMWLIAMTEGLLWSNYGFINRDIAIFVNSSFSVITSAMIVSLKLVAMLRDTRQKNAFSIIDK